MAENDMHTTLEMIRLAGQASAFVTKALVEGLKTLGKGLLGFARTLSGLINHVRTTGKQSYKTLNRTASRTGVPLSKPVEVPAQYCAQLTKDLNRYGVDFSVINSPKGKGFQQFVVKTANIETLNTALERIIAEAAQPSPSRFSERTSRFSERMRSAKEKADRFNAARAAEARNIPHPSRPAPVR